MKKITVALFAAAVFSGFAVDIPGAGESLNIAAGETLTVTDDNVADFLKVGSVHLSGSDSRLVIDNKSSDITLGMPISGYGTVRIEGQVHNKAVIITADNSGFNGVFSITNRMVKVRNVKGLGVGCTVAYTNVNDSSQSRLQLETPGEWNVDIFAYTRAHHGLYYFEGVTNNGTLRTASPTSLMGPGCQAGNILMDGGEFYAINKSKYLPGSTVSNLVSSSTSKFIADGGTLIEIGCKFLNVSRYCAYRDTTKFLAENVFHDEMTVQIGVGYAKSGKLDLNGFNQKCASFDLVLNNNSGLNTWITSPVDAPAAFTVMNQAGTYTYNGQINGGASFVYDNSSNRPFTLNGNNNTSEGIVASRKGRLIIEADAVFSNLSKLEVSGTGLLDVKSANINPDGVEIEMKDSGKLSIASGLLLKASRATVNGVYLEPGTYTKDSAETSSFITGDGSIRVLYGAPLENIRKYTWIGGTDESLYTGANWEGGEAPDLTDGTSVLCFSKGTASATVSGEIKIYGLEFNMDSPFTLNGAEGAKVILGEGGLFATNSLAEDKNVEHVLDVPVKLDYAPQNWILASTNTFLSVKKPLSSIDSEKHLVVTAKGMVSLYADNSGLLVPIDFTDLSVYRPPRVFHPAALGSPTRPASFTGSNPYFMARTYGGAFTNEVPLLIDSRDTSSAIGRYLNESPLKDFPLYLKGSVTMKDSDSNSQRNTYSRGNIHFLGGIVNHTDASFCFRMEGGNNWIEEKPIETSKPFVIDYQSSLNIAAKGNSWTLLQYYAANIVCQDENVLAVDSAVTAGFGHNVYFRIPAGSLNLNGYDQTVAAFRIGWDPKSTSKAINGRYCDGYTVVTSSVPASLEITGSETNIISADFSGAAGLHFNGTGTLTFTNHIQTTVGELKVSQGVVNLAKGSGWTATTNVVIAGGVLSVWKDTGAQAFGPEQDASKADLLVSGSGVLDIASGERATVRSFTRLSAEGTRWYARGVYGGPECR